MHALQRQVLATWMATTQTDTTLCQEHGLEVDAESVAIETAFAVTAVRVLDLECFQKGPTPGYESYRDGCHDGQVTSAMTLIRNAEIHLPVILDPDVERAVSIPIPDGTQRFRVFPKWVAYAELPPEIQASVRTKTQREGTRAAAHQHYEDVLEGRFVIETLLDVVRFFNTCDPSIARFGEDGELDFFPLPEIAQHDYERRHPDWPTRSEYESRLRDTLASELPGGEYRAITHALLDDSGGLVALCGDTILPSGSNTFIESTAQVTRDVRSGYSYRVRVGGGHDRELRIADGELETEEGPFDFHCLPSCEADGRPWSDWQELMATDAVYYARSRRI